MTAPSRTRLVDHASEGSLQAAIIELAEFRGWAVAHFRPARTATGGWMTPVQGRYAAGFPDLVVAPRELPDRALFLVEIKTTSGRPTHEQRDWLEWSRGYLWRPNDYATGAIDSFLTVRTEKDALEVARLAGWIA